MKRLRTICWFAQTAVSSQWCEMDAHRSTAPENARRSRETSTAGESYLLFPGTLRVSYFVCSVCLCAVYHLAICQLLPPVPAELSTFKGTTGSATCFRLTVLPKVCRSRPTLASLCMKKKVSIHVSWGKVSMPRRFLELQPTWANWLFCVLKNTFALFADAIKAIKPLHAPLFHLSGGESFSINMKETKVACKQDKKMQSLRPKCQNFPQVQLVEIEHFQIYGKIYQSSPSVTFNELQGLVCYGNNVPAGSWVNIHCYQTWEGILKAVELKSLEGCMTWNPGTRISTAFIKARTRF